MPDAQFSRRRVAVIGGGLAGLAAAARLAHAGVRVELFERNSAVGGKLAAMEIDGFRWDLGPSLLTLPGWLDELWIACGHEQGCPLERVPLDSACRYRWSDGAVVEEDRSFWTRPDCAALLRDAEGIYRLSEVAFLDETPDRAWRRIDGRTAALLRYLPRIANPRTLAAEIARRFKDPRIAQIFLRFATYNGSSPYRTPAALLIIPYVEARFGAWFVQGGMERIPAAVAALAADRGAVIRCGVTIDSIRQEGRRYALAAEGEAIGLFDAVVCNRDAVAATAELLPLPHRRPPRPGRDPSLSGFVMLLGVRGRTPGLAHHNILFSDDYPREFADLFERAQPAQDPTLYIAISSRTDPSRAPAGDENWFVLVNAPANRPGLDWNSVADGYAERMLDRIERFGFRNLKERVVVRRVFTPADFERRDLSWRGALYGYASHGFLSAFRRPPITPPGLPGFAFAGGATHPGGGIPLVLRSGKIAAARILHHLRTLS